jgi:hypothetical protein
MTESLKALLSGLIDYAGLFPPAKLPLADALANHRRYQQGEDAWMLGRFVCPAARLAELAAHASLLSDGPPLVVSAPGRGGAGAEELLGNLQADLADIDACRSRHAGRVVIDALEVRIPTDGPLRSSLFEQVAELTASAGLSLFFEAPIDDVEALDGLFFHLRTTSFVRPAGYKMRTGGLEAAAFPSADQIALAVAQCAAERVPFKATAGLHHPFPRHDAGVGARMHGFVNLFTAGVLAYHRLIGPEAARDVLLDESPANFRFGDAGLRWGRFAADTHQIVQARAEGALSFGSCSFDEPRDDLRALGWM